jgi:predicted Zn-dependent protease
VALQPREPAARRELAGVLAAVGRNKLAIQLYEGATLEPEDRYRLASLYAAEKDFAATEKQCRAILQERPEDKRALRLLAGALCWKKEHKEAQALLEKLAHDDPKDTELALRLAEVTLWGGDYDRAVGRLQTLLEAKFDQPELWRGYVDAAASAQSLNENQAALALRIYERAAAGEPKDVVFLARLAWLLYRVKEPAKAENLLAKVITLRPQEPAVRKDLAGTLAAVGRYIEALRMYEDLPLDLEDRYHLVGISGSAAQQYQVVLQERPDDKEAERQLAYVAGWKKVNQESLALFEKLARAAPQDKRLQIRLAEVTLWSGHFDKALALLQTLLEEDFNQRELWRSYVDAAASAERPLTEGHRRITIQIYEWMAAAEIKVEYLSRLAWVLYQAKETAKMERLLDRAVSLRPQEPAVRRELAGVLAAAGRYQQALQMYEGLKLTFADRLRLAEIRAAGHKFDAAEKEVYALLQIKPEDFKARRFLAGVLSWNKKYAEAEQLYQKLLRTQPDDATIPVRLAELALWSGDYGNALVRYQGLLDKAIEQPQLWGGYIDAAASATTLNDKHRKTVLHIYENIPAAKAKDPIFLGRMAWVLRQLSEPKKVVTLLKKAVELDPTSRPLRLQLAEVLYEQGAHDEAEKHFKILLHAKPSGQEMSPRKPAKP